VVAVGQLYDLGLSKAAVRHRLARGRLHPLAQGVYAVGRPEVDRFGRWMAAVLACGPTAALSDWAAGALLGILRPRTPIDVSVRTCTHHGVPGVRIHRREGLGEEDVTSCHGIPVTGSIRTLVDLAAVSGSAGIERMVNEADRLDLVDPETLRGALGDYRGQRGVARLRSVLDPRTFRRTRSGLERSFLRLVERAGLPVPLTREWVNGFEVDFFWPGLGLVVETDGLRYHRTPARQARDRRRDQAHTAAGMTQLRFTDTQIDFEAPYVIETLRTVACRLGASPDA
jgi:very-short-patch-repair endonuclease